MAHDERGSEQLRPRTVIDGSYRLDEKIAEGGMGAIWKATDVPRDRVVVLRFVLATPDESQLRRFMAQAESLAAIQNAHVAAVYQCGLTRKVGGLPYIATEWLSGRDLGPRELEQPSLHGSVGCGGAPTTMRPDAHGAWQGLVTFNEWGPVGAVVEGSYAVPVTLAARPDADPVLSLSGSFRVVPRVRRRAGAVKARPSWAAGTAAR
jgi:hypothetical protein